MTDSPTADLLEDPTWDAAQRFVAGVADGAPLAAAVNWVSRADPRARAAGYTVLGLLGLDDQEARQQLIAAAQTGSVDFDAPVRMSVASALGNLSSCAEAHDLLLKMVGDRDADVLAQVLGGLPVTARDPSLISDPWVQVVIELLDDSRPMVRDWAAFTLGTQTDVDGEDIYPAAEAAIGLARRRDARVTEIIEVHLGEPDVGRLWLEAATELADPRLHAALVRLRNLASPEPLTTWDDSLSRALAACFNPPEDSES